MNKKTIKNTFLVSFGNIIKRVIGFIYRIFLTRYTSPDQLGLYQLGLPFISLMITPFASGIFFATSRLVAEKFALGEQEKAHGIIKTVIRFTLIVSLSVIPLLMLFSRQISLLLSGTDLLANSITVFSPVLLLINISLVYDAYFTARGKAYVTTYIEIIEQLVHIGIIIFLSVAVFTKSLPVFILYIALGLSNVSTFILFYTKYKKEKTVNPVISTTIKSILTIAAPLLGARIIGSVLHAICAAQLPVLLMKYQLERIEAFSLIGIVKGISMPIILFPITVTVAITTVVFPKLVGYHTNNEISKLTKNIKYTISIVAASAFVLFIAIYIASDFICINIFKNNDAALYVRRMSIIIIPHSISLALSSILNAIHKQVVVMRTSIICSFVLVGLMFVLVPQVGINGYIYANFIHILVSCVLNGYSLVKTIRCTKKSVVI